jgi:vancomycin resistance protein YoaR
VAHPGPADRSPIRLVQLREDELAGSPGAEYVHSDMIQPGKTHSFNAGIGQRTRDRGFVEDGFIDSDGEIVDVVGGRVSQLTTTMVNTTWFAGIDLIEFRQHTIYFERYPMCREGTLNWNQL